MALSLGPPLAPMKAARVPAPALAGPVTMATVGMIVGQADIIMKILIMAILIGKMDPSANMGTIRQDAAIADNTTIPGNLNFASGRQKKTRHCERVFFMGVSFFVGYFLFWA